ncbi:LysE family translocator [Maritalea porphyrae]|uniref:LysE family translocator n=1 Tax=Maritalea porphyrae TaxID=880732 RepID=UPI0022AFF271|nr:LysE family translocator [Maritalea porphyrae]MCZ4272334.1 LysE family translocator [Maritalea porphyrae]
MQDLLHIFIPEWPMLVAFSVAGIILAITPGPDMALFLSRALNHGRAHGLAALAGACSGILVHTLLVALGISVLIAAAPVAFLALKIVGALYLLWLAFSALRSGGDFAMTSKSSAKTPSLFKSYLTGIGINLLNPKIVLFFITFLPQFVSATDPYAAYKLCTLGVFFVIISLPITAAMIFAADWLSVTLTKSKWIGRMLNYGFAAVFASFAAIILTAQARH